MGNDYVKYNTRLDIKFDHLERMDINEEVNACKNKWFNQTLTKVNDSVVSLDCGRRISLAQAR